jgi:hypothetical protein
MRQAPRCAERSAFCSREPADIHADGRTVAIDISDIYGAAADAFGQGLNITEGRY